MIDEVLLNDGVGGTAVGSVAGRKWTSLENHDKVRNMKVSNHEVVVHHLGEC